MCDTCGCGNHTHDHDHDHEHDHSQGRRLTVETDLKARNARFAEANRQRLAELDAEAVNFLSSPGAGKTTLLVRLLAEEAPRPVAVVEGDLATDNDARRIAQTKVPVHQIETESACHLDAHSVGHAMDHLPLERGGLVLIENVGNLVCPAGFDLGEKRRVVLLSVTEGDDKPEKYPVVFRGVDAVVISKVDLLPHVDFDLERCMRTVRALSPEAALFPLSARTGEGLAEFRSWLFQSTK